MGLLDTLVDPRIAGEFAPSEQEKQQAQSQALLMAGLGMLGSRGGFGNAVANGGMAGLQSYQQSLDNSRRAKMQQLETGLTMQGLLEKQRRQKAIEEALANDPNAPPEVKNGMVPYAEYWKNKNQAYNLGQGEKRFVGNQVVAEGAPKTEPIPSALKEYEFAKGQGYSGSFLDFQLAQKRAGASTTQIITPKDIIGYERDLRKDFEGLDPVKNYRAAYPAYSAVKDAATRNTPQSDINLVYGIAKLYDPNSVVREGEYNTIANSQAIPERLKGIAQHLAGGGKLTAETKAQLLKEADGRISAFEGEYTKAHGTYGGIVERNKLDPRNIFTPIGRIGSDGKLVEQTGGSAPSKNVMKGQVMDGYRFKGGNPADPNAWEKI